MTLTLTNGWARHISKRLGNKFFQQISEGKFYLGGILPLEHVYMNYETQVRNAMHRVNAVSYETVKDIGPARVLADGCAIWYRSQQRAMGRPSATTSQPFRINGCVPRQYRCLLFSIWIVCYISMAAGIILAYLKYREQIIALFHL